MNVSELFSSTQGEGSWAGQYTTFVRFGGCNVYCSWCDVPETVSIRRAASEQISAEDLVGKIYREKTTHVCLTGGEPLIQDANELKDLCLRLGFYQKIISVETNATVRVPGLCTLIHMWTFSPKLSSAENVTPVNALIKNLRWYFEMIPDDCFKQLKFVIGSYQDVFDLKQYLSAFPKALFYVQSEWVEDGSIFEPRFTIAELQEMFRKADIDFPNYSLRFGVQLHKFFNVK